MLAVSGWVDFAQKCKYCDFVVLSKHCCLFKQADLQYTTNNVRLDTVNNGMQSLGNTPFRSIRDAENTNNQYSDVLTSTIP